MWLDNCSPPRRLVFSPRATKVLGPRPYILGRLGAPSDITDHLSIVLDWMPPVSTLTPVHLDQRLLDEASTREHGNFMWVNEDSLGLSWYDCGCNVGSLDLMEEPTAKPATAVPMEPEQEEADDIGSPD
jgi:hypothetical protein